MKNQKERHLSLDELTQQVLCRNRTTKLRSAEIQQVIADESLEIVYQPIVDHVRYEVFAHEALSRPYVNGNPVAPDVLFQEAYRYHCSTELDLLAFTKSAHIMSRNEAQPMMLFVNAMPSSLMHESYLEQLDLFFSNGICQPQQLVIEITEQASYDPPLLHRSIRSIQSLGVRIAIDDVGTGEANLRAVVLLEPDFIKVDRSLIQGISESPSKQRLLRHLVGYMGSGDSVIAEGIENYADLTAVKEAGVNLSQGYYWAIPMPITSLCSLPNQIEIERTNLVTVARDKNFSLLDEEILKKSQELDSLLNNHFRHSHGL